MILASILAPLGEGLGHSFAIIRKIREAYNLSAVPMNYDVPGIENRAKIVPESFQKGVETEIGPRIALKWS